MSANLLQREGRIQMGGGMGQKEDTLSTEGGGGGGGGGIQRSNISKWRPHKSVREIYSSLAPFRLFLGLLFLSRHCAPILHSRARAWLSESRCISPFHLQMSTGLI